MFNLNFFVMKKILSVAFVLGIIMSASAQNRITNSFFEHVDYLGAFDGTNDWTAGWTEWDPVNAVYPVATTTKGNGQFSRATGLHLTANETWNGVILLDGWVYVDSLATLTIDPGTIIRGTAKSALIIERGGKIMAEGTAANPIVLTSNQGEGLRANSDWAGLVICGLAPNNWPSGEGIAEGGIDSPYGGNDPNDNSGILKYMRIEFPGYEVATGKEINGLTLCSVGDETVIDYIQVSYSGDDSYEWFGGTVNARHLVALATEDDDFDTDLGYNGMVQFGLAARDSTIVDTDTANGFESDNDEPGSDNKPYTNALFSNISAFGPAAGPNDPPTLKPKHASGNAMRLRRNTRLQIYNSIFLGYSNGLLLESTRGWQAAQYDSLTVQYSIIAGARSAFFNPSSQGGAQPVREWFMDESRHNDTVPENTGLLITDPFNYEARNFQPMENSPVLTGSYWWVHTSTKDITDNASCLIYPNPVSDFATVRFNNPDGDMYTFTIYNLSGQALKIIRDISSSEFTFNKGELPGGMYIYVLNSVNNTNTGKLVIR
jgi:hypothetical protein